MSRPENRRLTVAMIVRDAEASLPGSLDSVVNWADEVVVMDTGSTDATRRIVESRGVKGAEFQWEDSFAAARNACLAHATGDWVLWLNAGEAVPEQSATAIRAACDADPDKAYQIYVEIPPSVADGPTERVLQTRLVPNHPEVRFQGRVRESMNASLAAAGIPTTSLSATLLRINRTTATELRERALRNIRLAELAIRDGSTTADLLICLGEALLSIGDQARSIKCYRHAVSLSDRASAEMLEAYYGLLTALDRGQEDRDSQIGVCLEALEVYPLDAQLLCAMGGYLQAESRLDLAERSYRNAFLHGKIEATVPHLPDVHPIAVTCCSLALQLQNRLDEATEILEAAVEQFPDNPRVRRQMLDVAIKRCDRELAVAQVEYVADSQVEALRSAVRGACLATEKNWVAARSYLEAAFRAGCDDVICLKWYSVCLLALGEAAEAREVLQRWQRLDGGNPEVKIYLEKLGGKGTLPDGRRVDSGFSGAPPVHELPTPLGTPTPDQT